MATSFRRIIILQRQMITSPIALRHILIHYGAKQTPAARTVLLWYQMVKPSITSKPLKISFSLVLWCSRWRNCGEWCHLTNKCITFSSYSISELFLMALTIHNGSSIFAGNSRSDEDLFFWFSAFDWLVANNMDETPFKNLVWTRGKCGLREDCK